MKVDWIKTIIILILVAMVTWGCYEISKENDPQYFVVTITSFLLLSITGILSVATKFENGRQAALVRTTSIVMFIVFLISCLSFAPFAFSIPVFIICHVVLLLIYLLIIIKLNNVDY